MESEHNKQIDTLIEKTILFTVEQDVTMLQNRTDDPKSNTKKLLLLHLFIQLYQHQQTTEPTRHSNHQPNELGEIIDKIDTLQQQADTFIKEINNDQVE